MVTLASAGTARAEVEVGGVVGVHTFSNEGKLGVVDETSPESLRNSALFAGRVGVMFGLLGAEAEVGVIPTEPRGLLLDVTALTYRAHLVAQYLKLDDKLIPFAFLGAGVIQTVDSQNEDIVQRDKVVAPYLGIGAKYRTPSDWGVRLDVRAMLVPKVDSGVAFESEILLGVYKELGRPRLPVKRVEPPDEDPDKDGIVGAADRCPLEAEDLDGFEDTDGCSERDNDQDGVPDAADRCALEPEDKDQFEDDDGCPDPDNEADGVLDAGRPLRRPARGLATGSWTRTAAGRDPAAGREFNGVIKGITFKVSSADLAPGSTRVLDQAIAVMMEFPDIRLEIAGHTDDQKIANTTTFSDNTALSQARADSVKAYFVTKGIAEARLVAKGYGETQPLEDPTALKGAKLAQARAKNRRVEFQLIPTPATGTAAPPPTDQPPADAPPP